MCFYASGDKEIHTENSNLSKIFPFLFCDRIGYNFKYAIIQVMKTSENTDKIWLIIPGLEL